MRYSHPAVGAKSLGLMAICALVSFGLAPVSEAADPKPKTVVTTTSSKDANTGSVTLTADVGLMQMKEGAPHPSVLETGLRIWIEQHVPTSVSGSSLWTKLEIAPTTVTVEPSCCIYGGSSPTLALGSLADVAIADYLALCATEAIAPTANSIRVVAAVTVTNAQKGNISKEFLGRSVSMPNPCKQ